MVRTLHSHEYPILCLLHDAFIPRCDPLFDRQEASCLFSNGNAADYASSLAFPYSRLCRVFQSSHGCRILRVPSPFSSLALVWNSFLIWRLRR